jgi:hypothetical protein
MAHLPADRVGGPVQLLRAFQPVKRSQQQAPHLHEVHVGLVELSPELRLPPTDLA